MADIYLRSTDGSDGDTGLGTWANAKATFAAALTAAGAGGKVYMSQAHAESLAGAMTLASPGTAVAPVTVICVQDGGGSPAEPPVTLAATATVKTTGNNAITFSGHAYCYGVRVTSGQGATGAAPINFGSGNYDMSWVFDSGLMEIGTTSATSFITFAGGRALGVTFIDTTVKFHATGQKFVVKGKFSWLGGSLDVTSAIPTALFGVVGGYAGRVDVQDVDLSGFSGALATDGAVDGCGVIKYGFRNIKRHASTTVLGTQAISSPGASEVYVDNWGSGDTNYKFDHRKYQGSIVDETTIVRTGGASDGTTPISWKMVSLATPQYHSPLESPPIAIWNEEVGSPMTLTVEILHDSATALQNDEIWAEVEYLGTSGFPLALRASDRVAGFLTTPADQDASSEAWTESMENPNTQKLVVTFTPQEKGPIFARVLLAKASYTVYVCPKVAVA